MQINLNDFRTKIQEKFETVYKSNATVQLQKELLNTYIAKMLSEEMATQGINIQVEYLPVGEDTHEFMIKLNQEHENKNFLALKDNLTKLRTQIVTPQDAEAHRQKITLLEEEQKKYTMPSLNIIPEREMETKESLVELLEEIEEEINTVVDKWQSPRNRLLTRTNQARENFNKKQTITAGLQLTGWMVLAACCTAFVCYIAFFMMPSLILAIPPLLIAVIIVAPSLPFFVLSAGLFEYGQKQLQTETEYATQEYAKSSEQVKQNVNSIVSKMENFAVLAVRNSAPKEENGFEMQRNHAPQTFLARANSTGGIEAGK